MRDKRSYVRVSEYSVEKLKSFTVTNENGCWIWQRGFYHSGYGKLNKRGVTRVMMELLTGTKLEKQQHVCHTCDTKACINPEHLWIVSHRDNMIDMFAKGRGYLPVSGRGSANKTAKLNDAQVRLIRRLHVEGLKYPEIMKYVPGVTLTCIGQVARSETWSHVP